MRTFKDIVFLEWLYPNTMTERGKQERAFLVISILLTLAVFTLATWVFLRGNAADEDIIIWREAMKQYMEKYGR